MDEHQESEILDELKKINGTLGEIKGTLIEQAHGVGKAIDLWSKALRDLLAKIEQNTERKP